VKQIPGLKDLTEAMERHHTLARLRSRESRPWTPLPGPQTDAYHCQADELFYGGAAGGGKTDLMLGLALTTHRRALFLRREATQLKAVIERLKRIVVGRGQWRSSGHGGTMRLNSGGGERLLELSGCEHEDDREKYQGQDHDLKLFDELPHFSRSQYRFIIGWNRTDVPGQRCRVVAGGNPPTTPEARWVVEEWAPWLDPEHPDPARPGELRWYLVDQDNRIQWFKESVTVEVDGHAIAARSRTFIPAKLADNPVYMRTNYMSVLNSMPEPLRSQMLFGDFSAGLDDDAWQVIPSRWVRAAQARWTPAVPRDAEGHDIPLSAVGADVAHGGADQSVIAKLHGNWLAPLEKYRGAETDDGFKAAALILKALTHHRAIARIDAIGYGSAAADVLKRQAPGRIAPINVAESTSRRDRTGVFGFSNLRAYAYWHLRELLDPVYGEPIALPPDPELVADLCAARWENVPAGIKVERKDEIVKRLGRSPDCADAVVLVFLPVGQLQPPMVPEMPKARPIWGRESEAERRGLFGRGS
jgi:hypothetical protein